MRMRSVVSTLAIVVALTLGVVAGIAAPATAADHPSWGDVQHARRSASAKKAEVVRIQGFIRASQAKVTAAQALAVARGTAYQAVQNRVDSARDALTIIRREVADDQRAATAARTRAGQLAAQLSRTGGSGMEATLLLSGSASGGASAFLAKLGGLTKLAESNGALLRVARTTQNTAAATQARLTAATAELVELEQRARVAYHDAVTASTTASQQLASEQTTQATLAVELTALTSATNTTLADYQRGVRARLKAAAASAGGAAGVVAASGWALPASGPITDPYGYRPDRPAGANPFHRGVDIGGACADPIYAADAGTVIYAGWFGTYGNFIEISHGDGLSTGYAHIRPGGTFVHVGEHVRAGQNIASIGTTGASTGCHLHFEVRHDEVATDPVPFMATKGITIG